VVAEGVEWEIPDEAQPKPGEVAFDLDRALAAVLTLRAEIPGDAFTAPILGTERGGNAVLIGEHGLVLTIGYLVTEAERIWLSTGRAAVPGSVVGIDFTTGLALVQALGRLGVPALPLGSAGEVEVGDPLIVAAGGGRAGALSGGLAAKREFAGYWEYLLDEALFTIPAHPHWGGAAVIDRAGRLAGIGSLLIQESGASGQGAMSNMAVPIDLLPPVMAELEAYGRPLRPPRPWLGAYLADTPSGVAVAGLAPRGPAERAGLRVEDHVTELAGAPVDDLAELYRRLWSLGAAGIAVDLGIRRDGRSIKLTVRTIDRDSMLKQPRRH
jgi:S1-C subfamily serine protease